MTELPPSADHRSSFTQQGGHHLRRKLSLESVDSAYMGKGSDRIESLGPLDLNSHEQESTTPRGNGIIMSSLSSTSSEGEQESLYHLEDYPRSGSRSSRYPRTGCYYDDIESDAQRIPSTERRQGSSKGAAFRRFAESRALSPVILRDDVMDKYAEHLLTPPESFGHPSHKELKQIKSMVEQVQGSVDGIQQSREQLEQRVVQLEEMFKRTLEVVSLQRVGSAPASVFNQAAAKQQPLARAQSMVAADPNAQVASANGTVAANAPTEAVEVKDPYAEYLEACERYGRPFLCDAMLAFTTSSTSLKLATLADQDALPLALVLRNNCYISKLEIMDGLTDTGAIHLAQAFKGNDNLVEVVFEKCQIRDVGATALATWICKCEALKHLSLKGNNGMRIGAFTAISQALTRNRNLAVLDLSETELGDDGVVALTEALRCNQFLTSIDLSLNRITPTGLQVLIKCLKKGPRNVLSVNVEGNHELDGCALVAGLREVLQRNLKAREKLV